MLERSWSFEVWLDYGQVHLEPSPWTGPVYPETHPWAGNPVQEFVDDGVEVLDRAFATGIAQGRYLTVFITPAHDISPMSLEVELWDGRPSNDLPGWPEVFEAAVVTGVDGMSWTSPTMAGVVIPVPAGTYRAIIAGRGFLQSTEDTLTRPDNYRLQLWPCDKVIPPRRLSAWEHGPLRPLRVHRSPLASQHPGPVRGGIAVRCQRR